jgi:hypothetical protein
MFDWQTPLALFIVGLSIVVLIRKLFQLGKSPASGCGSCSNCPSGKMDKEGQLQVTRLIQIDDSTA